MINKDMTIGEIITKIDNAPEILMGFGMGCVGCPSAASESLVQACDIHGLDLEEVLAKLNENK